MQIGTKFSIAIHVLLCVEYFKDDTKPHKLTSDFIAESVNTNPVIIRKIMSLLRNVGLIEIAAGTGGTKLLKTPDEITMRDVYLAVNPTKDGKLFKIHNPEPKCPVGSNVDALLKPVFSKAQEAMENNLGTETLQDLLNMLNTQLQK